MSSVIRPLFGPPGINGIVNKVLTPQFALGVGQAAGLIFGNGKHRHRTLIGKTTGLPGYMLEPALVSGLLSVGMDVLLTGPIPAPGFSEMTRSMKADLGIMITGGDKPYDESGFILFGPDGAPLSGARYAEILALAEMDLTGRLASPKNLGRAKRIEGAQDRYIEHVKARVPVSLEGLRVVVDCANGASYKVAPDAIGELGLEVFAFGIAPNGLNINVECGAVSPEGMRLRTHEHRADMGFALGGDGGSVVIVDEKGDLVPPEVVAKCAPGEEDGFVAALLVLAAARTRKCTVSELVAELTKPPETLKVAG